MKMLKCNGFCGQVGTYIRIGSFVCAGTSKCDVLMAPFVHDETANWKRKTKILRQLIVIINFTEEENLVIAMLSIFFG